MIPHARLTVDEVDYLCALLHGHMGSIIHAKAKMTDGSSEWQRAEVAQSAVGWMLGWLQDQILDRADEFGVHLDLDAELRKLLEDGD